MAREKIVISSKTDGAKEIIENNKNGFLFEIENSKELVEKINFALDKKNASKIKEIQKNARKSVEKFNWDILIKKLVCLF
jgi:glycosyltransferase involved in cell wall biosynthesis